MIKNRDLCNAPAAKYEVGRSVGNGNMQKTFLKNTSHTRECGGLSRWATGKIAEMLKVDWERRSDMSRHVSSGKAI